MIRIAYISEVPENFGETNLKDVLEVSRRYNQRDEITGMMMYDHTAVLQILEGPEEKLRNCYNRIRVDPRHSGIKPLDKRSVDHRAFSDWSMGLVEAQNVNDLPAVNIHSFQEISERLLATRNLEGLPKNTRHVISTIRNFMSQVKIKRLQTPSGTPFNQ